MKNIFVLEGLVLPSFHFCIFGYTHVWTHIGPPSALLFSCFPLIPSLWIFSCFYSTIAFWYNAILSPYTNGRSYFIHYAKIPLLQHTIYSGFQLKTIVNEFTAVVKSKPLLNLQRLLPKNRCM
jgi:hypothetical protein